MEYKIRPYRRGEESYVADAHERVYAEEYRWGDAFVAYARSVALSFAQRAPNDREALWVAEADGKLVGCVMLCQTEEAATGQLRLYLVEKAYRRLGVGRALLDALLQKAREAGYRALVLWTASPLTDAIRHYEGLGFRRVEEVENTDWSLDGERLTEIKMYMKLS